MFILLAPTLIGVFHVATVPPMKIVVRTTSGEVIESACDGELAEDGGWSWRGSVASDEGVRLEWEYAIPAILLLPDSTRRMEVTGACTARNSSAHIVPIDATFEFPLPGAVPPGSAFDARLQLVLDADDDGGMLGVAAGVTAVSIASDGVAFANALPGPADLRTVPRRAAELRATVCIAAFDAMSKRKEIAQQMLPSFGESLGIRQRFSVGMRDAATLTASMTLSGILAEGTVAGPSVGVHETKSQTTIGARDGERIIIGATRVVRKAPKRMPQRR